MVLTFFLFLPLVFVFTICFLKKKEHIKILSLSFSFFHFLIGLLLLFKFDRTSPLTHQFVESFLLFKPLGFNYAVGVDSISLLFSLLAVLALPLLILSRWREERNNVKNHYIGLFIQQMCILGVFLSMDIALFYMFFGMSLPVRFLLPEQASFFSWQELHEFKKRLLVQFIGLVCFLSALATLLSLYESAYEQPSLLMVDLLQIDLSFVKGTVYSTQTTLFLLLFTCFFMKSVSSPFQALNSNHVKGISPVDLAVLNTGVYGLIRFSSLYFSKVIYYYSKEMCLIIFLGVLFGFLKMFLEENFSKKVSYFVLSQTGFTMMSFFYWFPDVSGKALFQLTLQNLMGVSLLFLTGLYAQGSPQFLRRA